MPITIVLKINKDLQSFYLHCYFIYFCLQSMLQTIHFMNLK